MDIKISKKKHSAVHNKVYPKNSPLVFNLRCKMEIYLIFTLCSQFITGGSLQTPSNAFTAVQDEDDGEYEDDQLIKIMMIKTKTAMIYPIG